jgi:hypothetical protein
VRIFRLGGSCDVIVLLEKWNGQSSLGQLVANYLESCSGPSESATLGIEFNISLMSLKRFYKQFISHSTSRIRNALKPFSAIESAESSHQEYLVIWFLGNSIRPIPCTGEPTVNTGSGIIEIVSSRTIKSVFEKVT